MSNVIKPTYYIPVDQRKTIELREIEIRQALHAVEDEKTLTPDEETLRLKDEILRDAEQFAETQIRGASEEAEQLRAEAREQIEAWWAERRTEDEAVREEARQAGFEQGFHEAKQHAVEAVRTEYAAAIDEASQTIRLALRTKQDLISEAEPFLIDLSCAIAEKIIGRQLELQPEWTIDLVKRQLSRKREKGVISLCVSPSRFPSIQEWRDELKLALDSQSDLQILPDPSVQDDGCVVRSDLGSIDARIDTQLTEIKTALLELSIKSRDERYE